MCLCKTKLHKLLPHKSDKAQQRKGETYGRAAEIDGQMMMNGWKDEAFAEGTGNEVDVICDDWRSDSCGGSVREGVDNKQGDAV